MIPLRRKIPHELQSDYQPPGHRRARTGRGAGRRIADSFRTVVLASQTQDNPNNNLPQFVQQLGMLMTTWQATTFLIGEYFTETDTKPIFTVADGLIARGSVC